MKKTNERTEIVSYNREDFELPTLVELCEMDLAEVIGGVALNPDCGVNCGTNCGTKACIQDGRPEV